MTAVTAGNSALVETLARRDSQRLRAYRDNLAFYRGQQWSGSGRRRERRLVFNYARALIDKTSSYLMSGVSFVVDEEDASPEEKERATRAERSLREVYDANDLIQLDFDSEIDASVLGDGVFKVTWDGEERRVRVSAPDVQGIYAWWLGDDVSRVWRVASRYQLSEEEAYLLYGAAVRSRRTNSSSAHCTVVEIWTAAEFELWLDGTLVEAKANPYGFIPFVLYPNLREPKQFWGVSDIDAVQESTRELNRALSQLL
jgi:hypothetical protein